MKKFYSLFLVLLISLSVLAQNNGFKYQAVVRDVDGTVKANANVEMQIAIIQGSADGTAIFSEIHNVVSNTYGVINLTIGSQNPSSFDLIDWANGPYFIKISIDGVEFGISQLVSVPFALHSKTSETAKTAETVNSITETDPLFTGSPISGITQSDIDGWSNKLATYTETDPIFIASVAKDITSEDITKWNDKLDEFIETDPIFAASISKGISGMDTAYWNSKLDEFIETDPAFSVHPSSGITAEDITKWKAVWIWYTTNQEGYLKTETDPIFAASVAKGITTADTAMWNSNTAETDPIFGTSIAKGITAADTAAWNDDGGATIINDLTDGKSDDYNLFLGSGSGANHVSNNTSKYYRNTAVGIEALNANISGENNVGIGYHALFNTTTGFNTAVGGSALQANTTGTINTAVGYSAMSSLETGEYNTATGYGAMWNNKVGHRNTAFGARSLHGNYGDDNTALGYYTGYNVNGSRNLFLGYEAGYGTGNASDQLYIGSSKSSPSLIYGDFSKDSLRINGGFVAASSTGNQTTGAFLSTSTGSQSAVLSVIAGGSANPSNLVHIIDSSGDTPNLLKVDGPSANEFMITNAGNVGIGVTDPDAKLEINGQIKITGGSPASGKVLTSDANGVASWENSWDSTYASIKNKPDLSSYATKDMGNAKITNLADPAASQDAATKAYVDLLIGQIEELQILAGIKVKDVEGNTYSTVTIGTQTWMAENLKTTKFNDGDTIPYLPTSPDYLNYNADWINNPIPSTPAYTWYNNDEATYKSPYGALYTYFAVATNKLCPTGWHVPSDAEWTTLTNYLGGLSIAGGKLKESGAVHWTFNNTSDNSSGFTGLPGGYRWYNGTGGFDGINGGGYHWSSTEKLAGSTAWKYILQQGSIGGFGGDISDKIVYRHSGNMPDAYSVRCIKD